MSGKAVQKQKYMERLFSCLDEYDRALLVGADNVGSKQFQEIRRALRPTSTILMGKNTLMKKIIRMYCEDRGNDTWAPILEHLVFNVGIVFTKGDLNDLKTEIEKYKVGAPARVGLMAPKDVVINKGGTGMDPSQTSFFQALNIPTKINKGTIEIVNDVHIIREGTRVGGSEATLLAKLDIKPFTYGLVPSMVYDQGSVFSPKVLDITDDILDAHVAQAISNITCLSLGANYPTEAAMPHIAANAFKNVLAIAAETSYTFPKAEKLKEYLEDPEAFMANIAPVAAAAPVQATPAAAKEEQKEEAKEEEEEAEDEDMGFSLFD